MKKILFGFSILIFVMLQACSGGDSNADDAEDTTPTAFYFTDAYGLGLGIWVESNTLEISGIDADAEISIENGEYSINGGAWTNNSGVISAGQNVTVRVLSSDDLYTSTSAILNVGGVEDTFYVRTSSLSLTARYNFKGLSFSWQKVNGASHYRLWYQATENADFTQFGRDFDSNTTGTRVELPIHTFNWFDAQFKIEACLDTECFTTQSVGVVTERSNAVGYFKSENTEAFDSFSVVALSGDGNTLAIAATAEDGNSGIEGDRGNNEASAAGAVYIYTKEDKDWTFQAYLKAANVDAGDEFGSSVALSGDGNTLAVSAVGEASGATGVNTAGIDNSAAGAGAVYIFQRIGEIWLQQSYLKASEVAVGDAFGAAVALSSYGGTLAVGAPGTAGEAGAVYLFNEVAESWEQQAKIVTPNTEAGDYFGAAVSITADGNQLLVGAPREASNSVGVDGVMSDNNSPYAGAAYLFARSDGVWQFDHYFKASNTAENQLLGTALSISADGSSIALGAPGEASSAYGVGGDQSDTSYPSAGAVYLFDRMDSNNWMSRAYVKASDGDAGDCFGSAVALNASGHLLVVGAPGEASANDAVNSNDADDSAADAGAAYVFRVTDMEWNQISYVKAPNSEAGDGFSTSLSLDASGNSLAIGAPGEDSSAMGVASNQANNLAQDAGAVYLF